MTALSPQGLVDELTFSHHQVMYLMVRPLHHGAHESERLDLDDLPRIATGHHKLHAVRKVLGLGTPSKGRQLMRVCGNHVLDRSKRSPLAGNRDLDTVVENTLARSRPHRHC